MNKEGKKKNGNNFFALQSKLFLAIIINAVSIHGEYGEAVNTPGCEPGTGRCDSCYSPQIIQHDFPKGSLFFLLNFLSELLEKHSKSWIRNKRRQLKTLKALLILISLIIIELIKKQ